MPAHWPARAQRLEPETSNLRIARNLLLILLAVLLLPYLLTPLYRAGHPVSTLMAWRWLTGAPVSRQWIDFSAISPCAAALGGGVRGRQILQPSRHRLGRAARRDRRRRGGRGDPRRLDHHPAGGEKPVPVAGPQRGPQGAGVSAGAVDRPGAAEAADPGNLSQHRRTRARPASSAPKPAPTYAFGHPASSLSPREAALLAAILPNPVKRSARNPGPGVRRLAGTYMARAQASGLQRCWSENRGF